MKKVLLFAMLLLPQLLAAQEIYNTYLKDGKQWVYSQVISESNCTDPNPDVFKYGDWDYRELHFQSFITVMGDTVMEGFSDASSILAYSIKKLR